MKTLTLAAAAALATLAAAPAFAQAAATTTTTTTTTTAGKLSIETTPIEQLAASPAAKAVLDKDLPGLTGHPAYEQFKGMTLKQLQPMSQGALTDAQLAQVQADLDKLPK